MASSTVTDRPKISIITVCLNEESGIEKTAKSVAIQDYDNLEWIVIDGGSQDGTLEILENYRPSMSYFISESDNGIYNAMNKGINLSTGDYLLFLNGGDHLASHNVLSTIAPHLPTWDLFVGDYITYHKGNEVRRGVRREIDRKYLFRKSLPHVATFANRRLFERNLFDEQFRIAGDYDFFLRAILKQRAAVKYFPHPIAYFDPNGVSTTATELKETERRLAWRKNLSRLEILLLQIRTNKLWSTGCLRKSLWG